MSNPMSRGKLALRNLNEVCADCGAVDPQWASLNRGILLCDECCSIHRSLGRHISQVKSLKKGVWNPTQLQMVHALNSNGANSIWEHSLLDPTNSKSGRRKPQPKDMIHPVKADFIRAKHQLLAFVFRPSKDDTMLVKHDLSRQLHASCRTANLETSLRLLSQGADPNYLHQEKGTTALHVAAKAGQATQVELLFVYGADPGVPDSSGVTPGDTARTSGHPDLAQRLNDLAYELTDRLTYFLCQRKPDHHNGQHFIVPEMSDTLLDNTELTKTARKKLQMLANHLFEDLAMDVYDEVDRRESESIWQATQQSSCVPFLPVNPDLSSTRNQGRQKLARLSAREFTSLVIDILSDARRRQSPNTSSMFLSQDHKLLHRFSEVKHRRSEISDDEPLYDSVASDDDYITTEQLALLAGSKLMQPNDKPKQETLRHKVNGLETSMEENLKRQLAISETKLNAMASQINMLKSTVANLVAENRELRCSLQSAGLSLPHSLLLNGSEEHIEVKPRTSQRPASMYEPREGLKAAASEYDCPSSLIRPVTTQSMYQSAAQRLPPADEVVRRTDHVTKRIQELWGLMQDPSHNALLVPCSDRIRMAVSELAAIFPLNPVDPELSETLRDLQDHTARLQAECARSDATAASERACFMQQVRTGAYDIAKATKQLVTKFQS